MHENVKAQPVDYKRHEEAYPKTQIRRIQQLLAELFLAPIVPRGLRSRLLGKQKEPQPVGGILFRLSKSCVGTDQKDAGHENTQNIKSIAAQGSDYGTAGRAIQRSVCIRVKKVDDLSNNKNARQRVKIE
jgi:hypothetical protein